MKNQFSKEKNLLYDDFKLVCIQMENCMIYMYKKKLMMIFCHHFVDRYYQKNLHLDLNKRNKYLIKSMNDNLKSKMKHTYI